MPCNSLSIIDRKYITVKIRLAGRNDLFSVLPAVLDHFIGFQEEGDTLIAYCDESAFNRDDFLPIMNQFGIDRSDIEFSSLKEENWNRLWEQSFDPVVVDDQLVIRASFHVLDRSYLHTLIIDPKMSFGTGHHDTTCLMLSFLLEEELRGKKIADIGCGTGILSVFCAQQGAALVEACDIDEWSVVNARENLCLNDIDDVTVWLGDCQVLNVLQYDCILANINKNVLLQDMSFYADRLQTGGKLLVSGFFENEIVDISLEAETMKLHFVRQKVANGWAALCFEK
jgi:ribosomal protein L11 methyltransferase